jgi:hypothetical protein
MTFLKTQDPVFHIQLGGGGGAMFICVYKELNLFATSVCRCLMVLMVNSGFDHVRPDYANKKEN